MDPCDPYDVSTMSVSPSRTSTTVTAFFVGLGLEVEGTPMAVEGEFLDTVIGIPDSRTEIVMLRPPDGGTRLELSSFSGRTMSPAASASSISFARTAAGRVVRRPTSSTKAGRFSIMPNCTPKPSCEPR